MTGGLGFIGSHLISANHEFVVMDNLNEQIHGDIPAGIDAQRLQALGTKVLRGDVTRLDDWERAVDGVDAIVHLAAETGTAQSMYRIGHYNAVNSQGTALMFEALSRRRHSVRKVVLSSSRSVYGEGAYRCDCDAGTSLVYPRARLAIDLAKHIWDLHCPKCGKVVVHAPTPEDAPPQPASIYAATKLAQEDLVRLGCEALGIKSVILRFQNVYGEGQSLNNPYTGILSIFSTRIRRNADLPIFEDGEESRDFVHVSDVARAIGLALELEAENGVIFNVGSGYPVSVASIARLLVKELEGASEIKLTSQFRVGDIRHCYADLSRARALLGFSPEISIETGLERFVSWVKKQPLPEDRLDAANRELQDRGLMGGS